MKENTKYRRRPYCKSCFGTGEKRIDKKNEPIKTIKCNDCKGTGRR